MSSHPPVRSAISGMSPSVRFRGRRSVPSFTGLSWHLVTDESMTSRRHLPAWTTMGTLLVAGTPFIENCPFASVTARAM